MKYNSCLIESEYWLFSIKDKIHVVGITNEEIDDYELEDLIDIKIKECKEPIKIKCNNKLYEYFIENYPEKKFILIK